jgi:hypothetical protein
MKKILRLVTTSVLTLTLVACGEASSSVSNGTQTSSSVPNVSSAYANVTSVTLSAATATLTQVLGAQRRVTVTAALNANTNPNLSLEWFVNGVKQAQISRIFDFTPTEAGSFAITARVGNLSSNTLTVTATAPVFVAKETSFKKANLIEIVADGGFNVSLVGASLDASSFYSIEEGKYVLNLEESVVQGTVVNVRFEKQGFTTTTVPVTFDTRTLSLDKFEVENATSASFVKLPLVNGVYQVVKPFEETTAFNKTYRISMLNKNVIPEVGTTPLTIETTVPAGATAVPITTKLVSSIAAETFTVTKDTVAGLYAHKITVGGKTLEIKVQVLEASAEILVNESKYTYVDHVTGVNVPYAVQLNRNITVDTLTPTTSADSFLSPGEQVPVTLNAAGEYVVEKQNETFYSTANFDVVEFEFIARHFAKQEFVSNQFSVALYGPTEFAAREQLFSGMPVKNPLSGATATRYNVWDLLNDGTDDNDILNSDILTFGTNFATADVQGTANTSHKSSLYQFIDAGTLPGLYTFVITAGPLGNQLTKEIKVRVVEPTARLDFVPVSFTSKETQNTNVDATRKHAVTNTAPNVYEIEKPVGSSDTYLLDWAIVLSNYQSKIVTDFQTLAADQALKAEERSLFAKTSGIKLDNNSKLIPLVLANTTLNVNLTDIPVVGGAPSYTVSVSKAGSGITLGDDVSVAHAGNLLAVPTGTNNYTLGGNITQAPTALEGETVTVQIRFYSESAGTALGSLVHDDEVNFVMYVSGYADVKELGGKSFADATAFGNDTYSLIDFSLQTSGPNTTTFPKVDLTRTAIRMNALSSGLAIYERSTAGRTAIDTALTAALKAEKALSYSAFNGTNSYFYNLEDVATPWDFAATEITDLTPVGTYTLTMMVDQLVKTITIIVKNPSTKVSVLSVVEDTGTDVNNYFNVDGLHDLEANASFTLGLAANSSLRITGTVDTAEAATNFVSPVSGVYTIALSAVTPDQLLGFVAVNDLPIGSYTYNISKKYPDGRVVTFNDIATVTGHDNNGLALFGTVASDSIKNAANSIFRTNWIINETGALLKGQYMYEFTINGVTRKVEVNVVESLGLDVTSVRIADKEMIKFGNGFLTTLANAIGNLEIEFGLNLVTENDYVRILSYTPNAANEWIANNSIANTVYTKLSELDGSLRLATLASGSSTAAADDTMNIVIEIYRVVPFSSTGTVLSGVGRLQQVSSQTLKLKIDAFA